MTSERLTSREVASFVARGFLRLDAVVPADLCAAALEEAQARGGASPYGAAPEAPEAAWPGRRLSTLWTETRGIGAVLRLPRIAGAIESLVGPDPLYDHHYLHTVEPGQRWSQPWHADAIIDPRTTAFDLQLFFFFHDTPREMGGTMILPGSHFRRVNESDIARYQNFLGQMAMACPAGSVLVCHHGIWHCGQPNRTDRRRLMWKLRLNPRVAQRLCWDTRDLDDPAIARILSEPEPWHGNEARLEVVSRIRLWRQLTGKPSFDVQYWLTRLENQP